MCTCTYMSHIYIQHTCITKKKRNRINHCIIPEHWWFMVRKNDFTGKMVILNHKQVNSLPERKCLGTRAVQRDTRSFKYRERIPWLLWVQNKCWEWVCMPAEPKHILVAPWALAAALPGSRSPNTGLLPFPLWPCSLPGICGHFWRRWLARHWMRDIKTHGT